MGHSMQSFVGSQAVGAQFRALNGDWGLCRSWSSPEGVTCGTKPGMLSTWHCCLLLMPSERALVRHTFEYPLAAEAHMSAPCSLGLSL